ncbi:MAG TPA: hypothetical protein VLF94_02450 [Chlamydiales bacterium]|nr:hypothetical protein [Chlamydiales bacterium]
MAAISPISFNEVQTRRLHEVLHRKYTYAPKKSSISQEITPARLINSGAKQLGERVRGIFIRGGLFHYARTGEIDGLASDMDVEYEVAAGPDWDEVKKDVYASVQRCISKECNFDNRDIVWWTTHVLPQQGKFAIYGLPTQPHPIEWTIRPWNARDCCIGSADALRVRINDLLHREPRLLRAPLQAIDGYDPETSWKLLEDHRFNVEPLERVSRLVNGFFHMCHLFSRSIYPTEPRIPQAFLDAFFSLPNYPLKTYLEKHYPRDPEGTIIYLLNYVRVLNECELDKDRKEKLERTVFEPICTALGCEEMDPKEMRAFFLYAICYLYLRSSERQRAVGWPEDQVLFRAKRTDPTRIGNDGIFTRLDIRTLQSLREPKERITSHPLLQKLAEKFPHPDRSLADFFRRRATEEFPPEKPVSVEVPPAPKLLLSDLIGKKPYKEIFQLCKEDPSLELDGAWLAEHPKEGVEFLLKAPLPLAKNHLRFCVQHFSRDALLARYRSWEPDLLAMPIEPFLESFAPFLEKWYPQQKDLIQNGLSRILQMDDPPFERLGEKGALLRAQKERSQKKSKRPPPAPKAPPPPPAPTSPIEKQLLRLPKDVDDVFKNLFAQVIIAAARESDAGAMGAITQIHHRLKFLWDHQPPPVREKFYLFNIHLLTFYLTYRQEPEVGPALRMLDSLWTSGFQKKVLTLEVLKKVNLLEEQMQMQRDEAAAFKPQVTYLEELRSALWKSPEGRKAFHRMIYLAAAPLKNKERHDLFSEMGEKALASEDKQLIPEALHYAEQSFRLLDDRALRIPALWRRTLALTMEIAKQIGQYRPQLSAEEYEALKKRGVKLSKEISEAEERSPIILRFIPQGSLEEQLAFLLADVQESLSKNEWEGLERSMKTLCLAVQHLETHPLKGDAVTDALVAILRAAAAISVHKGMEPPPPAGKLAKMEEDIFELAKRAKKRVSSSWQIVVRKEGKAGDEKLQAWCNDLITNPKSIGGNLKAFFRFIAESKEHIENLWIVGGAQAPKS